MATLHSPPHLSRLSFIDTDVKDYTLSEENMSSIYIPETITLFLSKVADKLLPFRYKHLSISLHAEKLQMLLKNKYMVTFFYFF